MKPFYFDIESIPAQDPAIKEAMRADADAALLAELAAVKAPSNYKDEAKIAEFVAKAKADLTSCHAAKVNDDWLKTSFDGGVGQVVAIGFAVGDGVARCYGVDDLTRESERTLLQDFFSALYDAQHCQLVGHNIAGFDIPFLWKRAMVLNVKPPFNFPRNPKPWSENICDTMTLWDSQQRAGGSMDRICKLFGLAGKGDFGGADVWPAIQRGEFERVRTYCAEDVERTRAMHKRMTFAS